MNARGIDDTGGPQAWYDAMPFITKNWVTAAVGTTVMSNLGVVSPVNLAWSFESLSQKFEVWRIFTPFLYLGSFGKPHGFQTLISIFLLYQYSKQYESGVVFNTGGGGGTADYAYMLLLGGLIILGTGAFFGLGLFFSRPLVYYVLYVWSKRNPTAQAAIWGIQMQAMFLPFAVLALDFILGNDWFAVAHGYVAGHIYFFLVEVVPKVYGKTYITTPLWIIQRFGIGQYVPPAPTGGMGAVGNNTFRGPGRVNAPRDPAAPAAAPARGGGHSWGGGGQRLGRD